MSFHSIITGTGSYFPPRVVPNRELESKCNTTDAWIREKIGITERRFADAGVGSSDLAVHACRQALEAASKMPDEVEAIIAATATPDYATPGIGVLIQHKLGCHKIPAFDVHNTSPGFLFSLEAADGLIRSGKYRCLLVVGAEVISTTLDLTPRGRMMSVIFGDGAGAVVLEAGEGPYGIVTTRLHSDGTYFDKLWCEAPGSLSHPRVAQGMIDAGRHFPAMDARFVFEKAVSSMSLVCQEVLAEQGLKASDIAHVVPHQANLRIIEAVASHLQIPMERVHTTLQKYGNTSAASIPTTLDEVARAGKIKKGELVLMVSFGSGLSWGAALVRWA